MLRKGIAVKNHNTKEGRSVVRSYLIDGLAQMGMVRKRSVRQVDHDKFLARLVDRLSYMSPDNLAGLRQYVVRLAGGKGSNEWPAEVAIYQAAYVIQPPPPRQSDYAQSLIRSALGRRASDEGWLVELFQVARRMGPPPGRYIISKLKEEADANRRRRARIAEYLAQGSASPDDVGWLDRYHFDLAECSAIIEAREEAETA